MLRRLVLPITLVAMALGFLISVQVHTQIKVSAAAEQINADRLAQMKNVLSNSQEQNTRLKKEHSALVEELDATRKKAKTDPRILARLTQLQMIEGTQEVEGPGIQISVDDRNSKVLFPLGPDNLVEMINILKFAGAEAISINDQRIIGTTAIVMSGSAILVNQAPINRAEGSAYELNAIGDQTTLFDYFSKLVADDLKSGGMTVSITKKTIHIPSYKGAYTFKNAVPLKNAPPLNAP